jgi:FkbM family methyltransferase
VSICALNIPGLDAGLQLEVHQSADVHISTQIRETGIWEPFETELFRRILSPGDVCIDVGANIGYFSVLAGHCVGESGQVFAFEPEPANAELLQRNIKLNRMQQRCLVEVAGLADQTGEAALYLHPNNLGDHQLYVSNPQVNSVAVRLLRGDDYFADRPAPVRLVKIDTQGAEYQVVKGLMALLRTSGSNLRLMVELTPFSLRAAGNSGAQLVELLAQLNLPFHIIDHIEHELVASSEQELVRWCNNVDDYPDDQGFMNILVGEAR